jgi:hypothetical protein
VSEVPQDILAVRLQVGDDVHDEEYTRLAGLLRRELLRLDVADVRRRSEGEAPEGARSVDVETLGTLLVSVASTARALRVVVTTINAWLGRSRSARSAVIEVDGDVLVVQGVSEEAQNRLIDDWIVKHAQRG